MWIIIIFSATLIDAIIERNERAGEEKKGMIGKIDFKTICILYSAQEEKISWAWRGGPRSSLYSTRWGTAPCSTRKEGRGPCSKTILPPSLEFLINVVPFQLFLTNFALLFQGFRSIRSGVFGRIIRPESPSRGDGTYSRGRRYWRTCTWWVREIDLLL